MISHPPARSWKRTLGLLLASFVAASTAQATDVQYANGSLIDLTTVRGTIATASANLAAPPFHNPAPVLLHKCQGGDIRFDNQHKACWWMMQLPDTYNVSNVRLLFYQLKSIGLQVKVATTDPGDWMSVPAVANFSGPLLSNCSSNSNLSEVLLKFSPAKAKFIRIEIQGNNGGEKGQTAIGENVRIDGLEVWGPNNLAISPAISAAQSTWAGASCVYRDSTTGDQGAGGLIDENDPSNQGGDHRCFFEAGGSPSPTTPEQPGKDASFFVTLTNRIMVSAVGYSAINDDRTERPRNVQIYTSLFDSGDEWTLQKTMKDIKGGTYVEIPFDKPVLAKRVRFGVTQVWNPNVDANSKLAQGVMAQLYVYGGNALPPDVSYVVDGHNQVGVSIFDHQGLPIRNMQLPEDTAPGTYSVTWDGLDNLGTKMPPGDYDCRVVLNPAIYTTVGEIGNTSTSMGVQYPITTGHAVPSDIEALAVDPAGFIYSADMWEEAAQDFRKWDRDTGQYVLDDHAAIRNGNPNGLAYAIAVDDKYIYCSTCSMGKSPAEIRRFTIADEKLAPFPAGANISDGHILVHAEPASEIPAGTSPGDAWLMKAPLHALLSANGKLYVADYLSNKIRIYDTTSGAPLGTFDVKAPQAIAVSAQGYLWIAHEHSKISVFMPDGSQSLNAVKDLQNVVSLALGPDDLLYAADNTANKIFIYKIGADHQSATLLKTFGQPAQPADYAPDHFYNLKSLAVDSKGYLTVAQALVRSGARVTRFAPDGKVVWDQIGGEFCSSGNYSQAKPDEVISQYFHRYQVDRKTGKFEFRGCLLATDPKYVSFQHGPMKILNFHGQDFAFQGYDTAMEVFRRDGDTFHLCSMFGSQGPGPEGIFWDSVNEGPKPPPGLWSWSDTNGNGKIDDNEINWLIKPGGQVYYSTAGVSVDKHGNALFCENEGEVREVPMTGFDKQGNPVYDLTKMRIVIPADRSPTAIMSDPRMAIRADDGSIYVDSRSKTYAAPPEAGGGWMSGWVLGRYDWSGKRLWAVRMPETCPGIDVVPGDGVMCFTMKYGLRGTPIYHYNSDGMLIGVAYPSPSLGFSAIPDCTGALSISRDPRDGIVDIFAEDCVGNRFRWQRMDDHQKPRVVHVWLHLQQAGQPPQTISPP